jgi:hypothetical protein
MTALSNPAAMRGHRAAAVCLFVIEPFRLFPFNPWY